MKNITSTMNPLMALSIAVCLGAPSAGLAQQSSGTSSASQAQNQQQAQSDSQRQQQQAQQQARPEIEQQRREAQQQAEKSLDKDAVAALDETKKAMAAIAQNKTDEALAAIERATGKLNVLLARRPETALIPVAAEVEIIDAAPLDINLIRDRAEAAERAVNDKDYPRARLLLHALTSELRVRVYNLPLATYPEALKEAARLLEQQKNQEARAVLTMALSTLVEVDQVSPLPIIVAQTAIDEAQAVREKDKEKTKQLLALAKTELERAKELGYAGKDPEYAALDKHISELEEQINSNTETASFFSRLKERVASFFKRQSEAMRS